jgi:hypothetical protein
VSSNGVIPPVVIEVLGVELSKAERICAGPTTIRGHSSSVLSSVDFCGTKKVVRQAEGTVPGCHPKEV